MFGPEGLWGRVIRLMRNRAHAEASIIKAVSDIAAAAQAVAVNEHLALGRSFAAFMRSKPEEVQQEDVLSGGCQPLGASRVLLLTGVGAACRQLRLHQQYLSMPGYERYSELWEQYRHAAASRPRAECCGAEMRNGEGYGWLGFFSFRVNPGLVVRSYQCLNLYLVIM